MKTYAYAGVGSRETPLKMIDAIKLLANILAERGFILRSGRADGADIAFEMGCDAVKGAKEIFLPWPGFNTEKYKNDIDTDPGFVTTGPSRAAFDMAREIMGPAHWYRLRQGGRKLHARNAHQIFGRDLNTPVDFVIYWAELEDDGLPKGGTRTAVRLAMEADIPTFNLNLRSQIEELHKFLQAA